MAAIPQHSSEMIGNPPPAARALEDFTNALGEVLEEMTAFEVSTAIVEHITPEKFLPWETYREIYALTAETLQTNGVSEQLRDRYLELRQILERVYRSLLSDPTSQLYQPNRIQEPPPLPDPAQPERSEGLLRALLHNRQFLRSLRKLHEAKLILDRRNATLLQSADSAAAAIATDLIYAQTVVQLDGEIVNRYSHEIFTHPQRDLILQIHQAGVEAGEKQWRELLRFVVSLIQRMSRRRPTS